MPKIAPRKRHLPNTSPNEELKKISDYEYMKIAGIIAITSVHLTREQIHLLRNSYKIWETQQQNDKIN
jgi:hypothetical protein